jgi:hypothetical protein
MHGLIAQGIGIIAVCISLSVFQSNKRSKMLKLVMVAALLYTVHFYLIGALTGAAMNLIGALRSHTFYKLKPKNRHWWILGVFILMAIVGGLITWQGPLSLLPLAGSICGGLAIWHTKPSEIRRWSLIATPMWFTYNAISGSYPGMLIDTFSLTSNLLGEYRFDHKHIAHYRRRLLRTA